MAAERLGTPHRNGAESTDGRALMPVLETMVDTVDRKSKGAVGTVADALRIVVGPVEETNIDVAVALRVC